MRGKISPFLTTTESNPRQSNPYGLSLDALDIGLLVIRVKTHKSKNLARLGHFQLFGQPGHELNSRVKQSITVYESGP